MKDGWKQFTGFPISQHDVHNNRDSAVYSIYVKSGEDYRLCTAKYKMTDCQSSYL